MPQAYQEMSSDTKYKSHLLGKWCDIEELAEVFRVNLMNDILDNDVTYLYISKLTRLWLELQPLMQGRTDMKAMEKTFSDFRPYYYNPMLLMNDENSDKIFKLEECLREALHRLGVTYM